MGGRLNTWNGFVFCCTVGKAKPKSIKRKRKRGTERVFFWFLLFAFAYGIREGILARLCVCVSVSVWCVDNYYLFIIVVRWIATSTCLHHMAHCFVACTSFNHHRMARLSYLSSCDTLPDSPISMSLAECAFTAAVLHQNVCRTMSRLACHL